VKNLGGKERTLAENLTVIGPVNQEVVPGINALSSCILQQNFTFPGREQPVQPVDKIPLLPDDHLYLVVISNKQ